MSCAIYRVISNTLLASWTGTVCDALVFFLFIHFSFYLCIHFFQVIFGPDVKDCMSILNNTVCTILHYY